MATASFQLNQQIDFAHRKSETEGLYLDLIKRCLVNLIYGDLEAWPVEPKRFLKRMLVSIFRARGLKLVWDRPYDPQARLDGGSWPAGAHTMLGIKRLDNLQFCVEDVLSRKVPGDLIETGVWRGGATIFMRAILKVHGVTDRVVWVADSFSGLPPPNPDRYPADAGDPHHQIKLLAVSLAEVRSNFEKYGLLDNQVRFLPGWFSQTLPAAPINRLAVIRLDGDMYESTMDALTALYPKLSGNGYLIVDDYELPGCKQAVDDYRKAHKIRERIVSIDNSAVYWQRAG
ncbi:MAG TPA: TylF/MycF family methyltransferase [Pyrinomonadaceae bacterium]|nr:TylF/MycF family methyltransferase [Pyrinomonadaceae bacterium]